MRTKRRAIAGHYRGNPPSVRGTRAARKVERQPKKRRRRVGKQRSQRALKRKPPKASGQSDLVYRKPPLDLAERSDRRSEQSKLARRRRKDWTALTYAEKGRRIRFGSKAICRNARDVRDLARFNARIAHKREMAAVQTWRLDHAEVGQLKRCIGFAAPPELFASNKAVRVETSYRLTRLMTGLYRRSPKHFYWITIIHSGWHDGHINTCVPLGDVDRSTRTVMRRAGLSWFGMIELDLFNNWPYPGRGLRITPHVHLLAWSDRPNSAREIRARLNVAGLRSRLGTDVVVVKIVRTERRLAHLCYYMTKPNHIVKALGAQRSDKSYRRVYSVEKNVRPGHTLRLAEILSYMKISELMLAEGEGRRIKERLTSALSLSAAGGSDDDLLDTDVREMWQSMMPAARMCRARVFADRD